MGKNVAFFFLEASWTYCTAKKILVVCRAFFDHWEVFRTRQHIFGIFRLFCPNKPKWPFFAKFELKISQRVNPVQKRSRYGKSFKFFILSENVAKKGFSHPERTQNHKCQTSNFENLRFVICGFGAFWVRKALFGNIFGKYEKFKGFSILSENVAKKGFSHSERTQNPK